MKTRLQTSLIITLMVTLCMLAIPGVAVQPASEAPTLSFAVPIADSVVSFEFAVSRQSLTNTANLIIAGDCEQAPLQVAQARPDSIFGSGLASEFDMPFFSFAGLMGGAVSQ